MLTLSAKSITVIIVYIKSIHVNLHKLTFEWKVFSNMQKCIQIIFINGQHIFKALILNMYNITLSLIITVQCLQLLSFLNRIKNFPKMLYLMVRKISYEEKQISALFHVSLLVYLKNSTPEQNMMYFFLQKNYRETDRLNSV